jgi:hypothetical protein
MGDPSEEGVRRLVRDELLNRLAAGTAGSQTVEGFGTEFQAPD